MNSRNLFNAARVLAAMTLAGSALAAEPSTPLTLFTAIEVEFPTEKGKVYQLEGSSNLVDWTGIGDPVFGSGRPVSRVFSTRGGQDVVFQSYRLETSMATTEGFAPWGLAGYRLQLDDQPGGDPVEFSSETEGSDGEAGDDAFQYVFTRVDLNTVTADMQRSADRRDLLTLTFTAADRGTWVRDEFRKDRLKDRDVGVFVVLASAGGPTNAPPVEPPAGGVHPPAGIAGRVLIFQDSATPDRLAFTSATNGTETGDDRDDDEPNRFSYVYAITGEHAARLTVTFKAGRYDEYELEFSSEGQGSFVRREFRDGRLKDTDRGSFSAEEGTPGGGGTNPSSGGGTKPEGTLRGLAYTMKTGETPDVLHFASDTSGTETGDDVDDDEVNTFQYTLTSTGDATALLVVRFKPDRWDEYDLTYAQGNAGTFVRREFKQGSLDDTDAGTFSAAATPAP